jgi:hypothetical protein
MKDSLQMPAKEGRSAAAAKRVVLYGIYALYCASFFMPAIGSIAVPNRPAESGVLGFQAFRALELAGHPLLLIVHPVVLVAFALVFFANMAAVLFPLVDALFGNALYLVLGITIGLCTAGVLLIPGELLQPLFYGFFVWLGSLVALAIGLVVFGALHVFRTDHTP